MYAGLGVGLVVLFDPRTWGGEVAADGDEVGILLVGRWMASFVMAMLVLTVVIAVGESVRHARSGHRRRSTSPADAPPERSWYE